ncbi:YqjK-like family protein [Erwinia aphidicola]|uniref:YqjK-like family protein n=1 Tax=Erwinia aphidicola TaxID=68334 RepID=UPI0030D15580
MSREREARKAALLKEIQQQRLDLSAGRKAWLVRTERYDHGWLALLSAKRYLALGSGLMAIWSARNPRKLGCLARRGLGLWSTWRVVRNYLPRR